MSDLIVRLIGLVETADSFTALIVALFHAPAYKNGEKTHFRVPRVLSRVAREIAREISPLPSRFRAVARAQNAHAWPHKPQERFSRDGGGEETGSPQMRFV
jgi:hypothetical protein